MSVPVHEGAARTVLRKEALPTWLLLAVIWGGVTYSAAQYWTALPQYAYGWILLGMCLYLIWREDYPKDNDRSVNAGWIAAAGLIIFLIAYIIARPNVDWRPAVWTLTLGAVIASAGLVWMVWGRAQMKAAIVPMGVFLFALPWPMRIELPVTQFLMSAGALIAVETLNAFGHLALLTGNIIILENGAVGMDVACSGIKSLQASLAAAVLLIAFFRIAWPVCLWLPVIAVLMAFFLNVCRALLLAFLAAREGTAAIERWHDPAGWSLLAMNFAFLLIIAARLRDRAPAVDKPVKISQPTASKPVVLRLAALLILAASGLVATEIWYRMRPAKPAIVWTVRWPENATGFRTIPIPSAAADLLRFDKSSSATWKTPDAYEWTGFFFEWFPGPVHTRILARSHRPEICLPAVGFEAVKAPARTVVRIGEMQLQFVEQTFKADGRTIHVFYCVQDDAGLLEGAENPLDWNFSSRMQAVLGRTESVGQRVLEIVISGPDNIESARRALEQQLPAWLESSGLAE